MMAQGILRDLTGARFGRLVVLERGPTNGRGATWRCRCDCGEMTTARAQGLVQGNTRSCGCMRPQRSATPAKPRVRRATAREASLDLARALGLARRK